MEAIGTMIATIARASAMAALLHMLVQPWAREGQVTSRDSRHTIFQPSREEGTQWWLIISSNKPEIY